LPTYKYEREDIIRINELDQILTKSEKLNKYGLPGRAWQCLISIMWLFGKRVSEVICLKTSDIEVFDNYLIIRFIVLKKRKKSKGIIRTYTKRITLDNPYTEFIVKWWNEIKNGEYLFPRPQTKMGHIYRQYVNEFLKKVKVEISPHLFRHSLATRMAEREATAYEMINWFDWDQTDSALKYIRRSGQMTQRLSNRKW